MSIEDRFLARLARGLAISQDEYEQMSADLPPEILAEALARRFEITEETQSLVEAARLFEVAGFDYEALELCSRSPRLRQLQTIVQKILPRVRASYPETRWVGKLTDQAFLVIDLQTGSLTRYPPIFPATMTSPTISIAFED